VTAYELGSGGSHDYDLPANAFARFDRMLAVTKMHVHGSVHNVGILRAANVKHVVLFRDLRDVAVSYVYYVRQTPWHPEQPIYKSLSTREGLAKFAERTLPAYADWVRSWQKHRDPRASLILRYEEMLANTPGLTARVAHHFGLDSSPKTISRIVQVHSFQRLSKGRQQGEESQCSFFRKGVSGDWKNHFSPALKDIYKRLIGDFLIEFGYEQDYSW
jgi:hypothetical protein